MKHSLKNRPKLSNMACLPDIPPPSTDCYKMDEWFEEFEKEFKELLESCEEETGNKLVNIKVFSQKDQFAALARHPYMIINRIKNEVLGEGTP